MAPLTSILVPTDFSAPSRHALRYATGLAEAFAASLHVLHVLETAYLAAAYTEVYPPPQEYFAEMERAARVQLDNSLTADEKTRFRATLELRTGSPAQEIFACLQEHPEIDLVVMATHGRGGVTRLMVGSVADKIVRASPCPVLTLRAPDDSADARAQTAR